jgi:hypothetical protein
MQVIAIPILMVLLLILQGQGAVIEQASGISFFRNK